MITTEKYILGQIGIDEHFSSKEKVSEILVYLHANNSEKIITKFILNEDNMIEKEINQNNYWEPFPPIKNHVVRKAFEKRYSYFQKKIDKIEWFDLMRNEIYKTHQYIWESELLKSKEIIYHSNNKAEFESYEYNETGFLIGKTNSIEIKKDIFQIINTTINRNKNHQIIASKTQENLLHNETIKQSNNSKEISIEYLGQYFIHETRIVSINEIMRMKGKLKSNKEDIIEKVVSLDYSRNNFNTEFKYDKLNRLIGHSINGQYQMKYTYEYI